MQCQDHALPREGKKQICLADGKAVRSLHRRRARSYCLSEQPCLGAGHEATGHHTVPAGEQPLRRGAPLPLQDSLRAGLLLAELLFNVPVDYMRAHQVPCL